MPNPSNSGTMLYIFKQLKGFDNFCRSNFVLLTVNEKNVCNILFSVGHQIFQKKMKTTDMFSGDSCKSSV